MKVNELKTPVKTIFERAKSQSRRSVSTSQYMKSEATLVHVTLPNMLNTSVDSFCSVVPTLTLIIFPHRPVFMRVKTSKPDLQHTADSNDNTWSLAPFSLYYLCTVTFALQRILLHTAVVVSCHDVCRRFMMGTLLSVYFWSWTLFDLWPMSECHYGIIKLFFSDLQGLMTLTLYKYIIYNKMGFGSSASWICPTSWWTSHQVFACCVLTLLFNIKSDFWVKDQNRKRQLIKRLWLQLQVREDSRQWNVLKAPRLDSVTRQISSVLSIKHEVTGCGNSDDRICWGR